MAYPAPLPPALGAAELAAETAALVALPTTPWELLLEVVAAELDAALLEAAEEEAEVELAADEEAAELLAELLPLEAAVELPLLEIRTPRVSLRHASI